MSEESHEERKRSFDVEVRTPSNAEHEFEARSSETVHELARRAVDYFVQHELIAAGEYGLALLREGKAEALDDASSLGEDGVDEGDVLVLISKSPKVDG